MIIFISAIAIILIVVALILLCKSKITFLYKEKKLLIILQILFMKFKITPQAKEAKEAKKKEADYSSNTIEKKFENYKAQYSKYKDVIFDFIKKTERRLEFCDINIKIDYGTGDAANTGIIYGMIWTLIANIFAFLQQYFIITFPSIELNPHFQDKLIKAECNFSIKFRIAFVLNAFLLLLIMFFKYNSNKEESK